jgi:hypothetical protein
MPGIRPIIFCIRPGLAIFLQLVLEIVQRELAGPHLGFQRRLLLRVDHPLDFADQRDHVAHPRIRPAMPSGRNGSSASRCSPVPMNLIGTPVTCLTDSNAPPRASPSSLVMITPSSSKALVERLGAVHRVLAGHAVHDQIHLIRLDAHVDPLQLLHQLLVDRQTAGRVQDHDLDAFLARLADRVLANLDRILGALFRVDRDAQLLSR